MHFVIKSYDNQQTGDDLFAGTYNECVAYIRKQKRLREPWAYDIRQPSGRLASYVL